MGASGKPAEPGSRLSRLLGFLERDPDNLRLIADAAAAASDEGALATATELIDRYGAIAPPPPELVNLKGLVALNDQRFADAASAFSALLAADYNDPAIRFNLAWCQAMLRDYRAALALLDDAVMTTAPRAAALKIQMMHHLGQLEEALACGLDLAGRYPNDAALMGALAAVALDAEDIELARSYATRAGETHEALSTLGMLALGADQMDASLALFERALKAYPDSARGLLGKGLGLLAQGDLAAAAPYIDRSAELFGDHLGTWVAAGWAYFVNADYATSRARFDKALAIDDTFAETHGGLAVLDIVEGRMQSAKRRADIALRLDPRCFSGALAKSLLAASAGDARTAARIRDIALNTPVGPNGRTLAQAMVGMGMTGRIGPSRS